MNMFRHHHISHYHEPVTPANFLQSFNEKLTIFSSREQRPALITTGGDEMQILRAVVSLQTCGHIRTYLLLITLDVTRDHAHPSKTAKGGAAMVVVLPQVKGGPALHLLTLPPSFPIWHKCCQAPKTARFLPSR